jgi:hypothetical protein
MRAAASRSRVDSTTWGESAVNSARSSALRAIVVPDGVTRNLLSIEMVDPEVIVEEPGDIALEPVELREGVPPDRDQEVRARGAVDRPRQLPRQRVLADLVVVVEKVLLEVVEDDEQPAVHSISVGLEHTCEVARRRGGIDRLGVGHRLANGRRDGDERVVRPRRDYGDRDAGAVRVARRPPERRRDTRAKQGCLPDARVAVKERQRLRAEVRCDDPTLGRATEEEGRVVLCERNDADERRRC